MAYEYGFADEVSAFERAHGDVMDQFLSDIIGSDEKQTRASSPEDRFIIRINAVATGIGLSNNDKLEIFNMIENQKINHIAYRNPEAFVLGYLASAGGSSRISKTRVKEVMDRMYKLNNPGIQEPDVIRYMRFWMYLSGTLDNYTITD